MSFAANIKVVLVGDGGVGKTSLCITHTTNAFPTEYIPTIFDNYSTNAAHQSQTYCLGLWDTAGTEEYDLLRPLSYPQTDVLLVCFSLVNLASFKNVDDKWMPELNHYCPGTPVILVGTKMDLRDDQEVVRLLQERGEVGVVTTAMGLGKQKQHPSIVRYFECSALAHKNLKLIFDTTIEIVAGLANSRRRERPCKLM